MKLTKLPRKMVAYARRFFKRKPQNKINSPIRSKWFGSDYGGFFLCERMLKKQQAIIVYSCGVGTDITFDRAIMKQYPQAHIFAFDPTPVSMEWINKQDLPKQFHFFPIGISNQSGVEQMFFPKKYGVSYGVFSWDKEHKDEISVQMETIGHIAKQHQHPFIDVLKMDIEGSEFSVLNNLDFDSLQIGQILVEFHERFLENGKEVLDKTLAYLHANGFECFAMSDDFEYSFINRRYIKLMG